MFSEVLLLTFKNELLFYTFQVCVTFTWKDAFDKGSLFGGSVKLGM